MKKLILLNRKFPCKSGEAFLENEIDEISKYFDDIYIYPSDICKNEKITRRIKSQNVHLRIVEDKAFEKRKKDYIISSCKYIFKNIFNLGLKNALVESYFLAASYLQAKKIINDIESLNLNKNDEIILYSYWLYINAKVGCILKEYFEENGYKVILISRAHRFDIYEERRKNSFLPHRKELLSSIDKIFACSDNGAKYLKEKYSQFSSKIEVGYLGTYDHGEKKYTKHNNFNIVSCSRISDIKRVDLIVKSLELIDKKDCHITWTHIGSGDFYDDVKNLAKEKLKYIEYNLVGAIPNAEVYDYYLNNDVDLFINVSSSEGLPVSIMEATSFGIPVIATNVGGTSEIVKDNISGFIIDEKFKLEDLSSKIELIKNLNDKEYEKLRFTTRNTWKNFFNAPVNYELFAKNVLKEMNKNEEK